jgi:hypothetical protein
MPRRTYTRQRARLVRGEPAKGPWPAPTVEVLHPAELTSQACAAVGGTWIERTSYMVHVWTVPGYESNRGVFSDINPAIACPDGTYYTVPEQEHERYKLNKCRSNPA